MIKGLATPTTEPQGAGTTQPKPSKRQRGLSASTGRHGCVTPDLVLSSLPAESCPSAVPGAPTSGMPVPPAHPRDFGKPQPRPTFHDGRGYHMNCYIGFSTNIQHIKTVKYITFGFAKYI